MADQIYLLSGRNNRGRDSNRCSQVAPLRRAPRKKTIPCRTGRVQLNPAFASWTPNSERPRHPLDWKLR